MFDKILIANRGEIAVRVIRSARKLGIKTVAIYAAVEKHALHVEMADEAYCLGEAELADTYLNIPKILEVAKKSHSDALHPGYGFLSENPNLVKRCEENQLTFIGPSSTVMRLMGHKIEARNFVKNAGIPVVEGITGDLATILGQSESFSYPVLVKAAAGGGGKGMRIVHHAQYLQQALEATSREAKSYFGDGTVYVEKYLEEPRHIEFQLLADHHGHVVHLFERECSIQRRYQKIIEEAPSPTLDELLRKKIGEAAVKIGREIGYTNAGTIEFLLDQGKNFCFLEMNTRIQVEHPVTEMTTGIDIVAEQIKIAAGQPLSFSQEEIKQTGHAIECRIYAESPENQFLPSPGPIQFYQVPQGDGVRLDTAIHKATIIDSRYDPMIGKMITCAQNRKEAIQKAVAALKNYIIHGIDTNVSFLIQLLQTEAFQQNQVSTKYCDQQAAEILQQVAQEKQKMSPLPVIAGGLLFNYPTNKNDPNSIWHQIGFWRHVPLVIFTLDGKEGKIVWKKHTQDDYTMQYQEQNWRVSPRSGSDHQYTFSINEKLYTCFISENEDGSLNITYEGFNFHFKRNDILGKGNFISKDTTESASDDKLVSPMPGKVIKLYVKPGDPVKKGEPLLIVEAMKMENNIVAPRDATIKEVLVSVQDMVERNKPLILIE